MKKTFLSQALGATVCCVLFTAVTALAQPSTGGPAPGTTPAAVPLDGGASILLATGVAYGLKRLRAARIPRP